MDSVMRYVYEAGMLKRTARSGWWAEGIKHPESVADHSFRTAVIAFILSRMEGLDEAAACRVCTAAVFHDVHEARLGDMNKITSRYVHVTRELEKGIEAEQRQGMPPVVRDALASALDLGEKERTIMKDADYLECAVQAREYADAGNSGTRSWVDTIGKKLKTASAKKLHSRLRTLGSNSWWQGLKRME